MYLKTQVERLRKVIDTDLGFIAFLALISIAAFGIIVPFVGYFWDDWIWKFFSYAYSADYLLWQPIDRPLAGTLHLGLNAIFGDNPLNWQLGNLFFRWANAAAFYWMLRKVFSDRRQIPALLAMFFLVYPGFSEQWISIAFIHHMIPMTVLWLSYGLMFDALKTSLPGRKLLLLGCSLGLALLVMLTTEYFYGIEIFRLFLLIYFIREHFPKEKLLPVVWETIKNWWPFGALSLSLVLWRASVGVAEGATYTVKGLGNTDQGLLVSFWDFIQKIAAGLYSATVEVLIRTFTLPGMEAFGQKKTIAYYLLLLGSLAISWWVFNHLLKKKHFEEKKQIFALLILGLFCLPLGGLPFWVGGLQYLAKFPLDRLGLSLMMGWSFLVVGLILLIPNRMFRVTLLSVLFSFSVASNFIFGAAYIQSWKDQQVFWWQFVTRVPALEPGTVVVSAQIDADFMNDLSFMMTLNWLYDQEPSEEALNYGLFWHDSRSMFETIEASMPLAYHHRMVEFDSTLDQILLISYTKNGCMYIFDPQDGYLNPHSRSIDELLVASSNLDQINVEVDQFDNWPDFFSPIDDDNWCYFYQLGQLELQRGNYAEVAALGDMAFSSGKNPNLSWERAPFIEGYGLIERWDEAVALTAQAMNYKFNAEALLCNVWDRINAGTPDTEAKQEAFLQVSTIISCPSE